MKMSVSNNIVIITSFPNPIVTHYNKIWGGGKKREKKFLNTQISSKTCKLKHHNKIK